MKQGNKESNKVFVYGTLKSNFGNHNRMVAAEGELVGEGSINGTMFSLGGFPKVSLTDEHLNNTVQGEVYQVDDEGILGPLDMLEGYPSFYDRKIVDVTQSDGQVVEAWVYFIDSPSDTPSIVEDGVWRGRQI